MDLNDIIKKAQDIKGTLEKNKQEFAQKIFTGKSGGGLVTLELRGDYKVTKLDIEEQIIAQDSQVAKDLIIAAFNNAIEQINDAKSSLMPEEMSNFGDFSKFF